MYEELKKNENARMMRVCGEGLKASLVRGFSFVAFTMAEILLSLTIIGVVAAITLPSLTGNINERTWNTQRKALHSRLSQAVALMPQVKGYGTLDVGTGFDAVDTTTIQTISSDNATEAFLTNGLAKVFKLNNICDTDNLGDCGLPDQIVKYGGEKIDFIKEDALKHLSDLHGVFSGAATGHYYTVETLAGAFETANGESVLVHYNPWCKDKASAEMVTHMGSYFDSDTLTPKVITCANFIYDLNGKKGPNTMGKDMGFMTLLYPSDSVVVSSDIANTTLSYSGDLSGANSYCKNLGDEARLPNMEELTSIMLNFKFLPSSFDRQYVWSSAKMDASHVWKGSLSNGEYSYMTPEAPTANTVKALCIKRSN